MNRALVAATAAALLTLTACGQQNDTTSSASQTPSTVGATTGAASTTPTASATAQGIGAHNSADTMFLQTMIAHHNAALDMAEPEFLSVAGPQVTSLARRIAEEQRPEIRQMTTWLEGWGESTDTDGMDMSSMPGMQIDGKSHEDTMDDLSNLSGKQFDQAWLKAMIGHHQGAVTMSKDVIAKGQNPEVEALAQRIIEAQTAEITEMRKMLG